MSKATAVPTTNGTGAASVPVRRPPKPQLPPQPHNLLEAIIFAASDPGIDIAKVEHLIRLRKEMEAAEAEQRFNDALAKAQSEMEAIVAETPNPHANGHKYATYAALDKVLRPIYTSRGFALTFTTGASELSEAVEVVAYVIGHGHSRRYSIVMPADGKGARGGDVMSRTHATASAISYGMRYLLCMAFNVAVVRDDDGNAAGRQSSASLKREGVWQQFQNEMRATKSLQALETVCERWRPRINFWSAAWKQSAVELKSQQIERLGGALTQLQESAAHLDQEEAERVRAAISEDSREPSFAQLYDQKPWR
jgi:hypothetical protein